MDKAGDLADEKTQGKYSDKIQQAEDKATEYISGQNAERQEAAPAETPPRADVPPANPLGTTPDESTPPSGTR